MGISAAQAEKLRHVLNLSNTDPLPDELCELVRRCDARLQPFSKSLDIQGMVMAVEMWQFMANIQPAQVPDDDTAAGIPVEHQAAFAKLKKNDPVMALIDGSMQEATYLGRDRKGWVRVRKTGEERFRLVPIAQVETIKA
jgi:hypothetical protein